MTALMCLAQRQRRPITPGQAHVMELFAGCTVLISGIVRPQQPKPGEMGLDELRDIMGNGGH